MWIVADVARSALARGSELRDWNRSVRYDWDIGCAYALACRNAPNRCVPGRFGNRWWIGVRRVLPLPLRLELPLPVSILFGRLVSNANTGKCIDPACDC